MGLVGRNRGKCQVNLKLDRAVKHWLQTEQKGLTQQADEALMGVFSHLPAESVPAGFADRLLVRAGLGGSEVIRVGWTTHWGWRLVVGLCLLLAALSFWVMPGYLPALLGIFNLATITEMGVSALVGVSHQLGSGLVVWRILSTAGGILSSTLSSPAYLMALFSAALLSLAAFRFLHEIVVSERSSRYASSV